MKFKKGDRVAMYTGKGREVGIVEMPHLDEPRMYWLDMGQHRLSVWAHEKQLRRLKKTERRRIWVTFTAPDGFPLHVYSEHPKGYVPQNLHVVEFFEVKKK